MLSLMRLLLYRSVSRKVGFAISGLSLLVTLMIMIALTRGAPNTLLQAFTRLRVEPVAVQTKTSQYTVEMRDPEVIKALDELFSMDRDDPRRDAKLREILQSIRDK